MLHSPLTPTCGRAAGPGCSAFGASSTTRRRLTAGVRSNRCDGALTGSHVGDMPHNWASAECVLYLRHMLALEDGHSLRLLAGIGAAPNYLSPSK